MEQFKLCIECQTFTKQSVQPEGTADAQHLWGKQQKFFLVIGKFLHTHRTVLNSRPRVN